MKTQTKNQNGGWIGKEQRKQQAMYLNKVSEGNKGKNRFSSEKADSEKTDVDKKNRFF